MLIGFLSQVLQTELQIVLAYAEHFTRLASFGRSHDASLLQLIHQTSRTVVSNTELALDHTGGTTLFCNNHAGNIFEHGIQMGHVHIGSFASFFAFEGHFWQREWTKIALLISDEVDDLLHLRSIYESTLHTDRFVAGKE